MTGKWWVKRTDSVVEFSGLDVGGVTIKIAHEKGKHVILRVPGHKYWSGRFTDRSYAKSMFWVARWLEPGRLDVLEEHEAGVHWKAALAKLVERVDELEAALP